MQALSVWCVQRNASAVQPSAALGVDPSDDDDDDDGSGDWDIMGSDPEAAIAPRAGLQAHLPPAAVAPAGRRSADQSGDTLNHVPVYDTGEPQYTFGDGGGPPVHCRLYAAVQDLAHAERPSVQVRPGLAACSATCDVARAALCLSAEAAVLPWARVWAA